MRKQEEYEKAKSKIFGLDTQQKEIEPEDTGKKKESKKKATTNTYDPAYDRNLTAPRINPTNVYTGPTQYNPMYGQMTGMYIPQMQVNMGGYNVPQGYGMPNVMMNPNYYPTTNYNTTNYNATNYNPPNYNPNPGFNVVDMNFPSLGGDANFPPLKSDVGKSYPSNQSSYPKKKDF